MPRDEQFAADDDGPDAGTRWERFTGAVSNFMLKPAVNEASAEKAPVAAEATTVAEIEAVIKRADDKERLIGLLAAPVAAGIGLLVVASLIAHDPKEITKHVAPSLYVELGAVTMALALAMLATAWFRKRTFLGIAMALYGLSIFNLHYWGFGLPFIIGGAWYLVRAYRLSERLKFAKAAEGPGPVTGPTPRPQPSKRYTPPTAPVRPPAKPKRGKELEAG
ncbi:MAG TPA: hypothetical protein VHW93_08145 [Acidimicrobiales bacterium]|jgi:hypothetical protein|nr:hypothetical protein [Acidimicrobiales bacterium]